MIPFLTRYSSILTKSSSDIKLFAHQSELIFIQFGIVFSDVKFWRLDEIIMIFSSIRYSIPSINSESEIVEEDHHLALSLIQVGIFLLNTLKETEPIEVPA